jgi:hypothetical protein
MEMASPTKLSEIIDALSFQMDGTYQYLNTETGQIVMISDEELTAVEEGEDLADYPDWQQESIRLAQQIFDQPEKFIELPSKFEIDEYRMMERFCLSVDDRAISDELYYAIKGRGAFGRFKDRIHRYGLTEAWYQYRDEAIEEIAKSWCEQHQIEYS